MKKGVVCALFCLLLATGLIACGGSDETANSTSFLAWTGSEDTSHFFELVRVDAQTGRVKSIGGFGFYTGLAYGPDGLLYGVGDSLQIINPTNGETTKIGDLMYQGSKILMKEAAFAPDGRLFVIENKGNRVFTVELTTGVLTLVGTVQSNIIVSGLEFSATGTLYASFDSLTILNAADMSTITTLGSTEIAYISELTFGGNGILYGMDIFDSTHIYSCDLNTGRASVVTPVSSIGLVSLVAERKTSPPLTAAVQAAPASKPMTSAQDTESLLSMEKAIKASNHMSR
jgi:hypothetical protein